MDQPVQLIWVRVQLPESNPFEPVFVKIFRPFRAFQPSIARRRNTQIISSSSTRADEDLAAVLLVADAHQQGRR